MKCKFLILFGLLNLLVACTAAPQVEVSGGGGGELTDEQLHWKFRGIHGLVLVLDAVSEKNGVTITDQRGVYVAAASLLGPKGRSISAYPGGEKRIPRTVRATWREGVFYGKTGGGGWVGGTIIGDYTVPVAERISDDVLDYIRKNGGALRIKIRLKDDGILIGWDVEERIPFKDPKDGNYLRCSMPRGDIADSIC